MVDDVVEFDLRPDEVAELDRLAALFTGGDRSAFLHEAIVTMAERARAEGMVADSGE